MATFGPLTAQNIQSAMWRHAFTSQRLVLVGPGATKLLVQLVGLYRDFRPGVSMATAWQLHDLLVQAQKAMPRILQSCCRRHRNWPRDWCCGCRRIRPCKTSSRYSFIAVRQTICCAQFFKQLRKARRRMMRPDMSVMQLGCAR